MLKFGRIDNRNFASIMSEIRNKPVSKKYNATNIIYILVKKTKNR